MFTQEQAQWLLGAIDMRLKQEGLQAAGMALTITTVIQTDLKAQREVLPPGKKSNNEDVTTIDIPPAA